MFIFTMHQTSNYLRNDAARQFAHFEPFGGGDSCALASVTTISRIIGWTGPLFGFCFPPSQFLLPFASMPLLNWIGNEVVVNHHHHVPFHLLKDVAELATGDPVGDNLMRRGSFLDERGLTVKFFPTTLAALK